MPHCAPVPWWGVLPFAMLLACIAVFPLVPRTARLWHHRSFQLGVALALGAPMAIWTWLRGDSAAVIHALVEYGQFITLLLSLFVASGGVFVAGDIRATPRNNVVVLAIGAVVASFIGTTGAAMLLVRPLLNINRQRTLKVHTIVFAVFVVANCGGLLTPLGDPPLFLGMLRGVPFLWTMKLAPEWAFVNGLLLATYYGLDRQLYAREPEAARLRDDREREPVKVRGRRNFIWLATIIGAVALAPSVDLAAILHGHAKLMSWVPVRELVMLGAAAAALKTGDPEVRRANEFSWAPILEVAALFIGIFLTMVPALAYLAQVAPSLPLTETTFFVFAGGLSSVLDNAPTYATFFEMARQLGGEPAVAGVREAYLEAISLGSVFCGALTYIGNGPNFMVKAIAEAGGVPMPTFGGYVAKWALRYLVPILAAMLLVFIVPDWRAQLAGGLLALALLAGSIVRAWRNPAPAPDRAAKAA